jgi:hypothetical protein
LGSFKKTFNDEQQKELVEYCKDLYNRFYRLSIKKLQQFALKNNIEKRFKEEDDWI